MQRPRNSGKLIKKIEQVIADHISDPSLNVSRIASLLGVSTQTLYQCTYKCFCEPPKTILDLYRLVYAMRMIKAHPGMNLTLLALQSGYNDYQAFSRCLKRKIGMCPKKYLTLSAFERTKIFLKIRAPFMIRDSSRRLTLQIHASWGNN